MTKDDHDKAIQYAAEIAKAAAGAATMKGAPEAIFNDVYQAIKKAFKDD